MTTFLIIALIVGIMLIAFSLPFIQRKKVLPVIAIIPAYKKILQDEVEFYNELSAEQKTVFENRLMHFLQSVLITGVNTNVEDIDKVLVAASAIIPILGFPDWEYINIREVLLYPDSFNMEFQQKGSGRNTLGMVGDGPYQQVMILSQHELRQGFLNKTGKTNTAIHEFVHLLDKSDGSTDGIPEFILKRQYILPWLTLMQDEIKKIMANRSDINPYGATNHAEFLAVVAEYFFERPDLLESKHPQLYELLSNMFRQDPAARR